MTEKQRCWWPGEDKLYLSYHDREWGVPEYDSRTLYEKLVLDGFQAGLSWITILRKRENFREAFHGFAPERIARYGTRDLDRLLRNEGIVRSRAKIEASVRGARLWLEIEDKEPGGFTGLIWKRVDGKPLQNHFKSRDRVPAETDMSRALSKELKQRGFNFVGPVIVYAFAQAIGMVNDHLTTCFRHAECARLGREHRPGKVRSGFPNGAGGAIKKGAHPRPAVRPKNKQALNRMAVPFVLTP